MQPSRIAHAYTLARHDFGKAEDIKVALRAIRDLLVLQTCVGHEPWDRFSFELEMAQTFGGPLDRACLSELHLAASQVIRCGRDKATFNSTVDQMFVTLESDHLQRSGLFKVYHYFAAACPNWVSHTHKARGAPRLVKSGQAHECAQP